MLASLKKKYSQNLKSNRLVGIVTCVKIVVFSRGSNAGWSAQLACPAYSLACGLACFFSL